MLAAATLATARRLQVIAVGETWAYLRSDDGALISLLGGSADRGPLNVHCDWQQALYANKTPSWPVYRGEHAMVESGRITLPAMQINFANASQWRPSTVASTGCAAQRAAACGPALQHAITDLGAGLKGPLAVLANRDEAYGYGLDDRVAVQLRTLFLAVQAWLLGPACIASMQMPVRNVLGLGRGLTPSCDDALAGLLLGLQSLGARSHARALACSIQTQTAATTLVSAAHLQAAIQGYATESLHQLLACWCGSDLSRIKRAVSKLINVGHSSGCDILLGACMAAAAVPGGWASGIFSRPAIALSGQPHYK